MNLESAVKKLSLGIASLAMVANISCSKPQHVENTPVVSPVGQASVEGASSYVLEQKVDLYKAKLLKLHYHKQYTTADLYRFYNEEKPASNHVRFRAYQRYFENLNNLNLGNKAEIVKLPDLNEDWKVGDHH